MSLYCQHITSEVGLIKVVANDEAVLLVSFVENKVSENPNTITQSTCSQLLEYMETGRKEFDLPLAPQGTDFQQQVWQALGEIPHGTTISYLDLAVQVGGKLHTRAVGTANGQNPIAIIIPCHRVIGSDGSLTGYAGGIERKRWLLNHEGALRQMELF